MSGCFDGLCYLVKLTQLGIRFYNESARGPVHTRCLLPLTQLFDLAGSESDKTVFSELNTLTLPNMGIGGEICMFQRTCVLYVC